MVSFWRDRAQACVAAYWRLGAGLLVLAALTYLFLWRLWASAPEDRATFPEKSDTIEVFFPARSFAARTLAGGGLPLWNPHVYAGYPQYADPQAATFYPPALALALATGARYGLETVALNVALHFWLAGAFAFLFFQRVLGRALPALLGGVAFEFGGYLTGFVPLQLSELEAAIWLPATLWVLTWAIDGRRSRGVALAGLAFSLAFLAGRPQSYLSLAPLCLGWLVGYARTRGAAWRTVAGWAALFAVCALGGAAVQWMPTLQLTRLSTRAHLTYAAVSEGGFAVEELAALLGSGLVASTPIFVTLYSGVVTLTLAAVAVARRRGLLWAALAAVFLLGSLGNNTILLDLLYLIERLGFPGYLRNVERLALGINFCLAALGALGLDQLGREPAGGLRALTAASAGVLAGAAGVAGLQALGQIAPEQSFRSLQSVLFTAVVLGLALLAVWLAGARRGLAQAALVGLAAVDIMSLNGGRFYIVNQQPQARELARMAAAPAGRSPVYRVAADQLTAQDFGSLLGLDNIGGMPPLRLRSYDRLLASVDEYRRNILLNVEVVATSGWFNDPAYALAYERDEFRYYYFLPAHTRAYLVQTVLAAAGESEAAALVAAPAFDHWSTAIVEGGFAPAQGPALSPGEGAAVAWRTANALQIYINAQAERLLVVANADYPGWVATVDGRRTPILRTNVALQGVPVPPGAHTVVLRFAPPVLRLGVAVSAITWAGVLGWGAAARRRARR